ncbi:MAG: SIS domain-containing protein [Kiloniellales bacterium]
MTVAEYLGDAARLLERMATSPAADQVEEAVVRIAEALSARRPLLVCGNGGSASDAMHITGELVGRFLKERKALKAICLSSNPAVLTAWSNDYSFETVFARQVEAYGEASGVLLGISTSGNSGNVVEAFRTARDIGMTTVGLTGAGGGKLALLSDVLIDVPSRHTPEIQQVHICLYHYICEAVEARCAS